jgi:predicted acylesterase/phospholipase RssA
MGPSAAAATAGSDAPLGCNVVVLPSHGVRGDRSDLLAWCRRQNRAGGSWRVGGVTTVCAAPGVARRCLKSLTSGEVRWFPPVQQGGHEDEDAVHELYEWAREEILLACSAGVDVLVLDELGPEVVHGQGLDSALRACLWKAGEEDLATLFVVVADASLVGSFGALYGIARGHRDDSLTKLSSFLEFARNERDGLLARGHIGTLRRYSWGNADGALRSSQSPAVSPAAGLAHANSGGGGSLGGGGASRDEEEVVLGDLVGEDGYEHRAEGEGPVYSIMRIPVLLSVLLVVLVEFASYVSVRQLVSVLESIFRPNRSLHAQMTKATHFRSWRRCARELDVVERNPAGSIAHVPTLAQFHSSLSRLSRQLALDKRRRALEQAKAHAERLAAAQQRERTAGVHMIPTYPFFAMGDDEADGEAPLQPGEARGATQEQSESNAPHQAPGLGDALAVATEEGGDVDETLSGEEHEIVSCLRAASSSLVELVNEQLYSMNHTGVNLQMQECVRSYLRALDEVESTSPEQAAILHLRGWQERRRQLRDLEAAERLKRHEGARQQLQDAAAAAAASPAKVIGLARSALGDLWERGVRGTASAATSQVAAASAAPAPAASAAGLAAVPSKRAGAAVPAPEYDSEVEEATPEKTQSTPPVSSTAAASSTADATADANADANADAALDAAFHSSKSRFFSELAHAYGETALCLSGGAANAYFHLGVVALLLEQNLLPRHLSGASGGALIGAYVCTRTDEELREELVAEKLYKVFNPCSAGYRGMAKHLVQAGTLFNVDEWILKMRTKVCGNLTFQEAFEKTGRSLTICVYNIDAKGRNHTRVLNHKTTPDVVIYSAVLASSALPKLLPPIELMRKDSRGQISTYHSLGKFWRDGSFENELPFDALRQLFNVTFPVVSQVEPHLHPFWFSNRGAAGKVSSHREGRGWRGGFVLAFLERLLKLDMKKNLELIRDFHLLPRLEGNTDISKVFLGRNIGSCTMVLPVFLRSYVQLISDPDNPKKMNGYLTVGRAMAYGKVGMLRDRIAVERRLQQLAKA